MRFVRADADDPARLPGALPHGGRRRRSPGPAAWRASEPRWARQKEVLPKHVTPETLRAVLKGLDYLAAQQAEDGSWISDAGGQAYPVAMTGLAGTRLPGPRQLADARAILQERAGGRRVPGALRHRRPG